MQPEVPKCCSCYTALIYNRFARLQSWRVLCSMLGLLVSTTQPRAVAAPLFLTCHMFDCMIHIISYNKSQ